MILNLSFISHWPSSFNWTLSCLFPSLILKVNVQKFYRDWSWFIIQENRVTAKLLNFRGKLTEDWGKGCGTYDFGIKPTFVDHCVISLFWILRFLGKYLRSLCDPSESFCNTAALVSISFLKTFEEKSYFCYLRFGGDVKVYKRERKFRGYYRGFTGWLACNRYRFTVVTELPDQL